MHSPAASNSTCLLLEKTTFQGSLYISDYLRNIWLKIKVRRCFAALHCRASFCLLWTHAIQNNILGVQCAFTEDYRKQSGQSPSSAAITGSVQQVKRCSDPVGSFLTPNCVPPCDLSVFTAFVSIAFHSPVDRAPLFVLATRDQWPDTLSSKSIINPDTRSACLF